MLTTPPILFGHTCLCTHRVCCSGWTIIVVDKARVSCKTRCGFVWPSWMHPCLRGCLGLGRGLGPKTHNDCVDRHSWPTQVLAWLAHGLVVMPECSHAARWAQLAVAVIKNRDTASLDLLFCYGMRSEAWVCLHVASTSSHWRFGDTFNFFHSCFQNWPFKSKQ